MVSSGPGVAVPQLMGLFADTAIEALRNAGLDAIPVFAPVEIGSSDVGRVIAQEPAAFEVIDGGAVVTITIGEGVEEGAAAGDVSSPTLTGSSWPGPDSGTGGGPETGIELGAPWMGRVHPDALGGVVVQTTSGIVHVDESGGERLLQPTSDALRPSHILHGVAEIGRERLAVVVAVPTTAGSPRLELIALSGGATRSLVELGSGEVGAEPFWNGRHFILVWTDGETGAMWFTGLTADGDDLELPWNRWTEAEPFRSENAHLILGVNDWQTYVGIVDLDQSLVTIEGFAAWGDQVHPPQTISVPSPVVLQLVPLGDRSGGEVAREARRRPRPRAPHRVRLGTPRPAWPCRR